MLNKRAGIAQKFKVSPHQNLVYTSARKCKSVNKKRYMCVWGLPDLQGLSAKGLY